MHTVILGACRVGMVDRTETFPYYAILPYRVNFSCFMSNAEAYTAGTILVPGLSISEGAENCLRPNVFRLRKFDPNPFTTFGVMLYTDTHTHTNSTNDRIILCFVSR